MILIAGHQTVHHTVIMLINLGLTKKQDGSLGPVVACRVLECLENGSHDVVPGVFGFEHAACANDVDVGEDLFVEVTVGGFTGAVVGDLVAGPCVSKRLAQVVSPPFQRKATMNCTCLEDIDKNNSRYRIGGADETHDLRRRNRQAAVVGVPGEEHGEAGIVEVALVQGHDGRLVDNVKAVPVPVEERSRSFPGKGLVSARIRVQRPEDEFLPEFVSVQCRWADNGTVPGAWLLGWARVLGTLVAYR